MTTTITTKGQVTIPKRVREALGVKPGHRVSIEYAGEGKAILTKAGRRSKSPFERFVGSAKGGLGPDEIMRLTRGEPDE